MNHDPAEDQTPINTYNQKNYGRWVHNKIAALYRLPVREVVPSYGRTKYLRLFLVLLFISLFFEVGFVVGRVVSRPETIRPVRVMTCPDGTAMEVP